MKELPFHVSEHAWAVHEKWLTVGLEVLSRALGDTYELLVPAGWSRGAAVGDYIMSYQEAVAWSTEVMQELKDAGGNALIPHGWERFWTEHSERATLSSGLAALGVHKGGGNRRGLTNTPGPRMQRWVECKLPSQCL